MSNHCHCCAHSALHNESTNHDTAIGVNCDAHDSSESWRTASRYLGAALFVIGMISEYAPVLGLSSAELPVRLRTVIFIVAWLLVGGNVLGQAVRHIARGKIFDENFLMSIATLGAFAIGEYPEGAAVMLFYQIGEKFQEMAVTRSRRSITALMDIRPDYANLWRDGETIKVSPNAVKIGELIVVKPGEKIPLDGTVVDGSSALDVSALTGESSPCAVIVGSEVFSGSINVNGRLLIKADKVFADSTVAKILELTQNASNRKTPAENFITRFAHYYTPAVVFAALGLATLPPLLIADTSFSLWLQRALIFLVVSCPCALVLSIPLSFFVGIGNAARHGILVKGSNFLSALNEVETVVFDKTGTLTKGVFTVNKIHPEPLFNREELLFYAAAAEHYSNHPVARSIVKSCQQRIDEELIRDSEEIAGKGMRARFNGKMILAGNARLLQDENIEFNPAVLTVKSGTTVVYIAIDGTYAGCLLIADEIKTDGALTIRRLKNSGIRHTVMLTGDQKSVAERIGAELGIDTIYAELLPQQKVEILEFLQQKEKGKIAFVGDGINDAPALARSDVGIAMGGLGSAAAIEAADVVLMTDEPSKLLGALAIAKKTQSIVWQNIVFALSVKIALLILGAIGIATMWEAVFGDVGVALIAVGNAMRGLRDGKLNS